MKANRTGSHFAYERGDVVMTPFGAATIKTDPDHAGACQVRLKDGSTASATTFQFTNLIRKFPGSRAARLRRTGR